MACCFKLIDENLAIRKILHIKQDCKETPLFLKRIRKTSQIFFCYKSELKYFSRFMRLSKDSKLERVKIKLCLKILELLNPELKMFCVI